MNMQALISLEPFRDRVYPPGTSYKVIIQLGLLNHWKLYAKGETDKELEIGMQAIINLILKLVSEEDRLCLYYPCAAEKLSDLASASGHGRIWIGGDQPGISPDTEEHEAEILRESLFPPPETMPGDVFMCIPPKHLLAETWWPWNRNGTMIAFPPQAGGALDPVEAALEAQDFDLAGGIINTMWATTLSDWVSPCERSMKKLAATGSACLYAEFGAPAPAYNQLGLAVRRYSEEALMKIIVNTLDEYGFICYRSKSFKKSIKPFFVNGLLPDDLEPIDP